MFPIHRSSRKYTGPPILTSQTFQKMTSPPDFLTTKLPGPLGISMVRTGELAVKSIPVNLINLLCNTLRVFQ